MKSERGRILARDWKLKTRTLLIVFNDTSELLWIPNGFLQLLTFIIDFFFLHPLP